MLIGDATVCYISVIGNGKEGTSYIASDSANCRNVVRYKFCMLCFFGFDLSAYYHLHCSLFIVWLPSVTGNSGTPKKLNLLMLDLVLTCQLIICIVHCMTAVSNR